MALIPFDDRDGFIWRDAKLHVLSHGLHYGSGVFEGERAYAGNIFRLRMHTDRLIASGRILGFEIPYSADEIDEACRQTLAANHLVDGYLRPLAWRGSEQLSVSAQHTKIHLMIATWDWPAMYDNRMAGIGLDWAEWRRPDPATAPTASKATGNYMIGTLSKHKAEAAGYADAMMLDWRGNLAEATGANVFLAIDGITRRTVMALARRRQIPVIERVMLPGELDKAQEVFLAGTAAEVTPVREISGKSFVPGRLTETLLQDYEALVRMAPAEVEARLAV
jgi:branched-chain amino acid aminotransferase